MPLWIVPALMAVMQYKQKQDAAEELKRNAASGILAQNARSLGGNTYGHQAALAQQRADKITQPDGMAMLQQYLRTAGAASAGQGAGQQPSATEAAVEQTATPAQQAPAPPAPGTYGDRDFGAGLQTPGTEFFEDPYADLYPPTYSPYRR